MLSSNPAVADPPMIACYYYYYYYYDNTFSLARVSVGPETDSGAVGPCESGAAVTL